MGSSVPAGSIMDYFAAMRLFLRAADLGSFSRAAEVERCKVSTVSRTIQALEADLGAALFNRTTRRLQLTEAGRSFRDRSRHLLEDLEEARAAIGTLNATPRGLLKINLPTAFGRRHVMPLLGGFLAAYPEVSVEVTLTDATVDLVAAEADVAVRIGTLADSTLVARKLAPHRRAVCAAPALARQLGMLKDPAALAGAPCLSFALQTSDRWYFSKGTVAIEMPVAGRIMANDSEALRQAALDGLGVALLPTWLVGPDIGSGTLVRLLDDWRADISPGPERAIFAVYPPKRVVSPKVRAFIDMLVQAIGAPPSWDAFDTGRGIAES